jgi:hypothetical protein
MPAAAYSCVAEMFESLGKKPRGAADPAVPCSTQIAEAKLISQEVFA